MHYLLLHDNVLLCEGTTYRVVRVKYLDYPAQGNPYNTLPHSERRDFGASVPYTAVR